MTTRRAGAWPCRSVRRARSTISERSPAFSRNRDVLGRIGAAAAEPHPRASSASRSMPSRPGSNVPTAKKAPGTVAASKADLLLCGLDPGHGPAGGTMAARPRRDLARPRLMTPPASPRRLGRSPSLSCSAKSSAWWANCARSSKRTARSHRCSRQSTTRCAACGRKWTSPSTSPWSRQLVHIRTEVSNLLKAEIESAPGHVRRLLAAAAGQGDCARLAA